MSIACMPGAQQESEESTEFPETEATDSHVYHVCAGSPTRVTEHQVLFTVELCLRPQYFCGFSNLFL